MPNFLDLLLIYSTVCNVMIGSQIVPKQFLHVGKKDLSFWIAKIVERDRKVGLLYTIVVHLQVACQLTTKAQNVSMVFGMVTLKT